MIYEPMQQNCTLKYSEVHLCAGDLLRSRQDAVMKLLGSLQLGPERRPSKANSGPRTSFLGANQDPDVPRPAVAALNTPQMSAAPVPVGSNLRLTITQYGPLN